MGTIAARDARTVCELTEQLTAIHLHALCQAADLRGPDCLTPATRTAHQTIRDQVPVVDTDRRFDHDMARIVALLRTHTALIPR